MGGFWFEVGLSAVEEDFYKIAVEGVEGPVRGFERLDTAVEAFACGIGDSILSSPVRCPEEPHMSARK